MSALDAVRVAPATNPVSQSVRDSVVVAKRNPIRMSRIPNLVRTYRPGSVSLRIRDRRSHALKEQVK
ncbi:integral membrane transport protein [Streptomyces sp. NBC_01017]|uniref:Integral membrane transport protein n=2 Tax=Streptomyces TaxID=1883 RepID=A0AAU1HUS9_9ACTN|nr:integral membrane transport protein [Streptomyces sp. NBC_01017]